MAVARGEQSDSQSSVSQPVSVRVSSAQGAEWYVENIAEELDFPREFYHDAKAGILYFVSGTSSKPWDPTIHQSADPPAELLFEHSSLKVLVHAQGTQAEPVKDVSLQGLTLTGA